MNKKSLKTLWIPILFSANSYAQNCNTGKGYQYVNSNNINTRIQNCGDLGWDLKDKALYEVPKGSSKHTIFASTLWIGGIDSGGNLHQAAMTYRQNGSDFFPGPLDTISGKIDSLTSVKYDTIWKVSKTDIDLFRARKGTTWAILNWPGNPFDTSNHFTHNLAPYVEVNGNGKYDPQQNGGMSSDYPLIKGNQMLWWVFNDFGNKHGETNGKPLGVEIHGSAYEFNCSKDTSLFNTMFLEYEIFNRSPLKYDSLYIGNWTDFELGYQYDDFIGSDSARNTIYVYNGNANDAGKDGYGTNPPVQSITFLNKKMTNAVYYNNDFTNYGNPQEAKHYYYYLTSRSKDGVYINNNSRKINYMCSGDPLDTTKKDWTRISTGDKPGDKRMIGSARIDSFLPKSSFKMAFAYTYSRNPNGDNLKNIIQNRKDIDHINKLYNGGLLAPCDNTAIEYTWKTVKQITICPIPSTTAFNIQSPNTIQKVSLYDINGKVVSTYFPNSIEAYIPTNVLPDGIYPLKITTENGVYLNKILVAH